MTETDSEKLERMRELPETAVKAALEAFDAEQDEQAFRGCAEDRDLRMRAALDAALPYLKPTTRKAPPPHWSKEKIAEARTDLVVLHDPTPSNPCYNDGYYAQSLVKKYGMSISELEKLVGKPAFKTTMTWE